MTASNTSKRVRKYPLELLWNSPAFRMIGDIYYVGDKYVSSHLITSEEGHILIDTCMPSTSPFILKGVVDLGFNPKDIEYILITQAHIDHLGSTKLLAKETGAKICIGEADREAAEKGSTTKMGLMGYETFKVDLPLVDGDKISVGDKELQVYHTPGHTPGCCSLGFQVVHENREYNGFIFGGAGLNVFEKENLERGIYGGTPQAFEKTLDRLEGLEIDVWLGSHPEDNGTFKKHTLLKWEVQPNPYIDPVGWKNFIRKIRQNLQKFL